MNIIDLNSVCLSFILVGRKSLDFIVIRPWAADRNRDLNFTVCLHVLFLVCCVPQIYFTLDAAKYNCATYRYSARSIKRLIAFYATSIKCSSE